MALPVYSNKGAFQSGVGALTVPVPTGYAANNLLLLLVESANEAIATPSGWTQATNSPQSTGTAAAAGGVRLGVFWRIATASEASVSVADTGNHTTAIMLLYTGNHATTPIHITAGSVDAAGTTSMSFPTVTTTLADCLIVLAAAMDTDAASTTTCTGYTNAALSSITERHDQTVASGVGGGLVVADGGKATSGVVGATTATGSTSVTHAYLTLAVAPDAAVTVALTGQSLSAAQGSTGAETSMALGGQAVAVGQGSVAVAASDVTAALTGQGLTVARGSVSAVADAALSGQAVSTGAGSASAAASLALTGQSVAVSRGTAAADSAKALTGQAVTVAQGSATAAASKELTGQAVTVGQGSVSAGADVTAALTGQSLSVAAGSVSAAASKAISGHGVAVAQGSVPAATARVLGGQSAVAGQGSVSVAGDVTAALSGQQASVSAGSVSVAGSQQQPASQPTGGVYFAPPAPPISNVRKLAGARAAASIGRTTASVTVALSGVAVESAAGTLVGSKRNEQVVVPIRGVAITARAGFVTAETTYPVTDDDEILLYLMMAA